MKKFLIFIMILLSTTLLSFDNKSKKEIPLFEKNGMLYVELTINNKKGYFLIDTGAGVSLLDISKSKYYNFDYYTNRNTYLIGISGEKLNRFYIKKCYIYYQDNRIDTKFSGLDFSLFNLNKENKQIQIIGILGTDILKYNNAVIDYSNNVLLID